MSEVICHRSSLIPLSVCLSVSTLASNPVSMFVCVSVLAGQRVTTCPCVSTRGSWCTRLADTTSPQEGAAVFINSLGIKRGRSISRPSRPSHVHCPSSSTCCQQHFPSSSTPSLNDRRVKGQISVSRRHPVPLTWSHSTILLPT